MFSAFDKAATALIMAIVGMLNLFGLHFGLDQSTVTTIVTMVTPILVYLIPNLPKDATP